MKALLLGDGPHYYRYFDALCFQSVVDSIVTEVPEQLEDIQIVAVTEPYTITSDTIRIFSQLYDETIILIEKMPTSCMHDLESLLLSCRKHKVYFINSRVYSKLKPVLHDNNNHVLWPFSACDKIDPVGHVLPNIIDFYYQQTGYIVTPEDVILTNCNPFTIKIIRSDTPATFVISADVGKVIINGEPIEWPNQFENYSIAFSMIFSNCLDRSSNHNYIRNEIQIINKIHQERIQLK